MRCAQSLRIGLAVTLLWLGAMVHAATPQPTAPVEMVAATLAQARAAVVGVQVTVSADAPTAETIGRERQGSGVVIDADGLILTIGYLILDASTVDIVTPDGHTLPARALAYDVATGLGLIQPLLPLHGLQPMPWGRPGALQPGEPLVVISGGEAGQVELTRLAQRRAFSGSWEYHLDQALYTSPPADQHSGAALFNLRGELLGIGSLLLFDVGSGQPGNLFVPVDLLTPILAELRRTGSSRASHRPWLGVTLNDREGRVAVVRVAPGSPAESAGLRPGDLLLAVDGVAVDSLATFYKKLWDRPTPQSEIELTVLQRAQLRHLRLQGADRASELAQPVRLDGI